MWVSSFADFGLRTPQWPYWTFLRLCSLGNFHPNFCPYLCIRLGVWWLFQYSFPVQNSYKLILSWHMLPRKSELILPLRSPWKRKGIAYAQTFGRRQWGDSQGRSLFSRGMRLQKGVRILRFPLRIGTCLGEWQRQEETVWEMEET